jgi:hypothetical protein
LTLLRGEKWGRIGQGDGREVRKGHGRGWRENETVTRKGRREEKEKDGFPPSLKPYHAHSYIISTSVAVM